MIDRPNHRAAAERMLADADEWAAQAEEPTPEAGELSCLAWAAVHALLAIHDTLTAADRYAANEAKQREAEPDPLDEDDHRDRIAARGAGGKPVRISRHHAGCWHSDGSMFAWHGPAGGMVPCIWSLEGWNRSYGPLAFAPDADGAPSVTAPVTDDPADDAEGGSESQRRNLNAQTDVLCPNCGHDIDVHTLQSDGMRCRSWRTDCQCNWWPSWIAARLIKQAVKEAVQ